MPGAGSSTKIPSGFKAPAGCSTVAEGVEYLPMRRDSPAANMKVGHIAPNAPVRLQVINSNDRIAHDDEALEVPSEQCRGLNCLLGINGDFHDSNHEPLGGVVTQGRLIRTPNQGRPHFYVFANGRVGMGDLPWTATVKTKEGTPRTLGVTGINTSIFPANGLLLYTSDWGSRTRSTGSGTVELIVSPGTKLAPLGQTVTVNLSALDNADSTIPAGGAVLSGKGSAATFLRDLWNPGVRQVEVRADSPHQPVEALGGNPFIIGDGQNAYPDNGDSFVTSRQPRTFVGFSDAGDVFIVTADGRQSSSQGMSIPEAANFLRGLGATHGMNFDGGGGTVFVKEGQVVSSPVDDDNSAGERGAPNSLAVVIRPPTPGAPLPPGPRSGYWMVGADGSVYRFGDARQPGLAVKIGTPLGRRPGADPVGQRLLGRRRRRPGLRPRRRRPLGQRRSRPGSPRARRSPACRPPPPGGGYWIFTNRGRVLRLRRRRPPRATWPAITLNGPVLDSMPTAVGQGLLHGRLRRRHLHLRRRRLPRLHGQHQAQRPGAVPRARPRRRGLLAGGLRRWRVHLRGRRSGAPWAAAPQQAGDGHGRPSATAT